MVAERREITSLRQPPEGVTWEPDPAPEARRRRLRTHHRHFHLEHNGPYWPGPRADATSTADLPTLTPGLSSLPTSCQQCGSALLSTEPPLGEHRRGLVSCGGCGQQLCWLAPPLVTTRSRPHLDTVSSEATRACDEPVTPTLRRVLSGRFTTTPGCGPACSIAYGHDAATH